jgi:hypothetical protein
MTGTAASEAPDFTTYVPSTWTSISVPLRKTIAIAREALADRIPFTLSKSKNYVASVSYTDATQRLGESLLDVRSDRGTIEFSCDAKRFELRIFPGCRSEKTPLVSIRERHPVDRPRGPMDPAQILAILDEWHRTVTRVRMNPHEDWKRAADYVGALALMNGASDVTVAPLQLTLPSRYGDGSIKPTRQCYAKAGSKAVEGLDLDLSRGSDVARTLSMLCHATTVVPRQIASAKELRMEYDLSGELVLHVRIPDVVAAMRTMSDVSRRPSRMG